MENPFNGAGLPSRTGLGLGTISTQNANAVAITGGAITGITDLAIADGGTGASTAIAAFDALSPNTTKGDIAVRGASNNARLPVGATDGMTLLVNSNSTNGIDYFPAGPANNGYISGRYYGPFKAAAFSAASSFAPNVLYTAPMYISKRQAFTAIGLYIATGTNVRFGIFGSVNGQPVSLALDAGAKVISAGAQNDVAISITFDPGWVFPACVFDATATANAIASVGPQSHVLGYTDGNTESGRIQVAHTYGALPSPFGTPVYSATAMPFLLLKV